MRGVSGDARGVNNTLDTISAAATAIASAEHRVPQATVQKRRWGSCWSLYWCFGAHKHSKRIGHAVLVPETAVPGTDASAAQISNQAPAVVLPFVAPPSSPASFLQSEPPSAAQSPAGLLSLNSISANIYSPCDRPSIFAIGPYAHETQLVSPPVFSTFTTEPSTAPFTPPPESVHLTTPSSPEVPFAQLLDPNHRNGETVQRFALSHHEFQSYQLYPGSPVGHLISPSSGISGSGTSSPFPDREYAPVGPHFLEFRAGEPRRLLSLDKLSTHEWGSQRGSGSLTPDTAGPASRDPVSHLISPSSGISSSGTSSPFPDREFTPVGPCFLDVQAGELPKLLSLENLSTHEWGSRRGSGSVTPDAVGSTSGENVVMDCQIPEGSSLANLENRHQNNEVVVDHRVSFELTAEDVVRCMEKEPAALVKIVSESLQNNDNVKSVERPCELANGYECRVGGTVNGTPGKAPATDVDEGPRHQKHRSITLGSAKEFNFDNADGEESDKPNIGSDWWANEKAVEKEGGGASKNWSFFPMMQPGVS